MSTTLNGDDVLVVIVCDFAAILPLLCSLLAKTHGCCALRKRWYIEGSLLRRGMWQGRLSHLPIHKHKPGQQEQSTPHHAHCRQDAQMFEAQANRGGTDREDTEPDQAIDATHAALQGIWYNREAIAAHQDSAYRVEDSDTSEDGS